MFDLRLILVFVFVAIGQDIAFAQVSKEVPNGFQQVSGKHITLITDLPLDDEIRALPDIFDKAVPTWCEQFLISPKTMEDWHVTCYLMLARDRFKDAGFIPKEVPEFPYGWQYGDQLWVVEQPSPYYRLHLLLHEGTHWVMYRKYGFYNTPWLAEGMSELLGTHRWQDSQLTMGIIPATRTEVPYWGRIKLVRDQCIEGIAPSLEEILRYDGTAHQRVDAYAWSWALVVFFENHPDTAKVFGALLRQSAMESKEVERWLRTRLSAKLPRIRAAWRAFISELDYGYSVAPGLLKLSEQTQMLSGKTEFEVNAQLGWQATGVHVEAERELQLSAIGFFSVAQEPKPWNSTPAGVSLEYYRGQPIGKLLMVVLDPQESEASTELVDTIPVGDQLKFTTKNSGEIFFKVNESAAGLRDNVGKLKVQMEPIP